MEERLQEYGKMQVVKTPAENSYLIFDKGNFNLFKDFYINGRNTRFNYILPITSGGEFLTLIMLHKLTQSL